MNQLITREAITMSSREIADLVGSKHEAVRKSAERLSADQILTSPLATFDYEHRGNIYQEYRFGKRDSLVLVARLSPEFTAVIVDRWQELESKEIPTNSISIPDFSNPAAAARAWAEQYESAQSLLIERDAAIATKAEIGSRREATAMNTASQAVRKATSLEQQLDQSKAYCTVKRMTMIHHGQPFDWRQLKAASADMGIMPIDVFDQNYGTVKAYHADVWREVYGIDL